MTLAEFLAWEERQALRYEFDGIAPVAMTGGTVAHDEITANIRAALKTRLASGRCRALGPNVKILAAGRTRYPDALVTCAPIDFTATIAEEPVAVFEVISTETAHTDRIERLREYQATDSIQHYVMVEQTEIGAMALARKGEEWVVTALTAADTLRLAALGIDIPLAEFYAGLDMQAPDAEQAS